MQGEGQVNELVLLDGVASARIACPPGLVPLPGQYVLAYEPGSMSPLSSVLFRSATIAGGFVTASPLPSTWRPGSQLHMRGPLGHGFNLPASAQRIALVAFRCSSRILVSLLESALAQHAAVTWVGDRLPDDLPLQVEAQPPHALQDVYKWADYVAFDLPREALPELKAIYHADRTSLKAAAQVLVRTPMPCGALAACGVCTVDSAAGPLLACEDGPVFDLAQLLAR